MKKASKTNSPYGPKTSGPGDAPKRKKKNKRIGFPTLPKDNPPRPNKGKKKLGVMDMRRKGRAK